MNSRNKQLILIYGNKRDFSGPVSEERILAVEAELELGLPSQYRTYIRLLGSGGIDGTDISGIEQSSHASVIEDPRKYHRRGLPSQFIVVEAVDDYGGYMDSNDLSSSSPV